MNLAFLPTPEEFARAHATPRAYVVVDHHRGLHWVPRPVYVPPRPCDPTRACVTHGRCWIHSDWDDGGEPPIRRSDLRVLDSEVPTVRRASSLVVAERMIAEGARQ